MTEPTELLPYEDPKHKGNSAEYHTGELCVEPDCEQPAGTAWSPLWCFVHNAQRIKRISRQLDEFIENRKRSLEQED